MNRTQALGLLAVLLAGTALAFLAPLAVASLLAATVLAARHHRAMAAALVASTLAFNAIVFGFLLPGEAAWTWGVLAFGWEGVLLGLRGGIRIAAVLAINVTVLSWIAPTRLLDGLHLPAGVTAFLGALVLAAQDLARDASRLVDAARLEGTWPANRLRRAVAVGRLLPALVVVAIRRSTIRAEALRLAGHATGPDFAALVAVTALASAGRMAFVAVPNVSLAYVVVFAGGLLFGPRLGALAGALSMLLTDFLLTGLYVVPLANVPAMALVGVLGGLLRPLDLGNDAWLARLTAAALGFVATLAFSVAADLGTWLLVAEFRATPGALQALLVAGLAFNLIPAVVNAVLFFSAIAPLARAAQAVGWATVPPRRNITTATP